MTWISAIVRWSEWRDSKVPLFLVALLYAALARPHAGAALLGEMALVLALLCAYAAFGHMINDYSDREADRKAGKRNAMATLPPSRARAYLAACAAIGLLPSLYFLDRPPFLVLLAASYLVAAGYSMPPARFKERPVLGVAAAALAQRTLPAALVFAAFGPWDWIAAAITLAATLVGLRFILVHQIMDHANDVRAGLRTFGTVHGPQKAVRLIHFLFPIEAASLAVAVLGMAWLAPLLLVIAVLYPVVLRLKMREFAKRKKPLTAVSYVLLTDAYTVYWPLSLALVLALREPLWLVAVMVTIAFQWHILRIEWLNVGFLLRQSRVRL